MEKIIFNNLNNEAKNQTMELCEIQSNIILIIANDIGN